MPETTMEFDLKSFVESLALSEGYKILTVIYPPVHTPNVVWVTLRTPQFSDEISVAVNWVPEASTIHFSIPFEFNFDTEDDELVSAAMMSLNMLADKNYISRGYMDRADDELGGVVAFSFEVPESFLSTEAGKTALWEITSVNFERMLRETCEISGIMTRDVHAIDEDPSEVVHPTVQ
jgi:hypothetical protein